MIASECYMGFLVGVDVFAAVKRDTQSSCRQGMSARRAKMDLATDGGLGLPSACTGPLLHLDPDVSLAYARPPMRTCLR